MENYLVSARKYRPSTFNAVVGQKSLTATLKNSIATDRLAHAYLFCGSRGVGKTSCARIFAKTINCEHRTPDGDACNECESCKSFNEGRSLNIIELDAASNNSVDDIRTLVDQVQVPPTSGKYRVFIVDEVHMLSQAAFNAFLKTLEEPPSYVIFILATTEKHKIIPTILSRCQIYDFNRITIQDMVEHLAFVAAQEGITAEPAALNVIARKADGAMRDALSIFDQVAASSMGNITYKATIENLNILDYEYYTRLIDAFLAGDVPQALLIYKEIRDQGFDSLFFINGLASHFRDLMVAREPSTLCLLETSDESRQMMAEQAHRCTPDFIYAAMSLCNDADLNYRIASNKQFLIELTLIKLCQLRSPSPNKKASDGEGQLKKLTPLEPSVTTPAAPATKPQPQPIVNKATPPSATATPPTPESNTKGIKSSGLSLKQGLANANKSNDKVGDQATAKPLRTSPYSDQDLLSAWEEYISTHSKEIILVSTMRTAQPKRVEGDRFIILVENPAQHDLIHNKLDDILSHLHNKLSNDNIIIDTQLNEGESAPYTWNDREVLAHMVKSNPHLKNFIDDFHLSIL